jgi:DNA-directed RNA polymerase sigma subunit (sigma70/sigma32)
MKRDQDGQEWAELKKIAEVRQIVLEYRQLTVRSIAEQANINRETVRKILTEDLDMRKVCAKMVPKELPEEQKLVNK